MKVNIVTKNYQVKKDLREVLDKKLVKLERYFDDDVVLNLNLKEYKGKNNNKCVTEAKIILDGGRIIRATVRGNTMYDNIDIVIPKIEGQIRKLKSHKNKKLKKSGVEQLLKQQINLAKDNAKEKKDKIARRKVIDLTKMSVDDAIYELELLDYSFYTFLNKDNNMVNIVYRREDETIGLMDFVY